MPQSDLSPSQTNRDTVLSELPYLIIQNDVSGTPRETDQIMQLLEQVVKENEEVPSSLLELQRFIRNYSIVVNSQNTILEKTKEIISNHVISNPIDIPSRNLHY